MSSSERTLLDLAVARLRRLFPKSAIVRELDSKLKPPVAATVTAQLRSPSSAQLRSTGEANAISARCKVRGCVWPAAKGGLCRGHLIDAVAEASSLPSALGSIVLPFRTLHHGHQAAASR